MRGITSLSALAVALVAAAPIVAARPPNPAMPTATLSNVPLARIAQSRLPVALVENRGQLDARVRYYGQGPGFAFFLTQREVMLSFLDERAAGGSSGYSLALRFVAANERAALDGDRAPGAVNYLHGSDPSQWRTGLRRYDEITYRQLWPGIDLHLREQAGTVKYEFHLMPGASPAAIQLAYDGATQLSVDGSGALRIGTPLGTLRDAAPLSYQVIQGKRVAVASRFAVAGDGAQRGFGIAVGAYRQDHELVVDPGIVYSSLLGGASHEMPGGTAVDPAGNVYVVGFTQSPDFPTTAGAFRRTGAQGTVSDVFVTKMNATGSALIYSTFLGGSDFDFGRRIAIDAAGNAFITGQTKSSDFPTTAGAFDRSFNILNCPRCGIDQYDAFVAKLNASGSALLYSTFLGGTDIDDARGIEVDGSGNAYVTGETTSHDFPTTAGALQRTFQGAYDVFVTKLNAAGSALVYSTFLAGTNVDNGERIAVDATGSAYVAGFTSSTDFPTTPGAYDTSPNGDFDVFLAKLNASGSALVYSTLLGGQGADDTGGLAIDAAGNAYLSGATGSLDFPTTPGAFDVLPDGGDAFVTKLNANGTALIYSTVVSGSAGEGALGLSVDPSGAAWITGATSSTDFPVTAGAFQPSLHGVSDAFVAELNSSGTTLLHATYLGGGNADIGDDIATDARAGVFVIGHTFSLDFPATVGAFDTVFNGDLSIFWGDAFVTKFATNISTSAPIAGPPVPAAPALLAPANASVADQPITFDWADVPAASSYTIQIDDSAGFTSPLVRTADLTTSIYATTGLATVPHFWRVRGVNINGVAGAWSVVRSFTPGTTPPPAVLGSISTQTSSVIGGIATSGTAVLSVGAPEGGAVVSLSSSNPGVASVPATVSIAANGFAGSFEIATTPVTTNTTVTVTGSYNGTSRSTTLLVTAAATPASVQSLLLVPSTVVGGQAAQAVVTLSSAAPSSGATVALTSSNPAAAVVPAAVTVAPGSATAVFIVQTNAVAAATTVAITGSYGGTTSASLTVTAAAPPPPPPPPPQTATVTLTASGRSGVHVTSAPSGLDVVTGSSGSAGFAIGSAVTVTVGSGRTAIFSGSCASAGKVKSCTFTVSGAATVTANVQ